MPLLIAVILGLVLFFIKKDDSARKAENKKETDKEWNLRQDFRDEYTNRQFENQVLAFVENPEHREQVNQEIAEALSEMRYQKRGHQHLSVQDKLDILLANRGKVSSRGAELGYWIGYRSDGKGNGKGYVRDLDDELEQYGFMVWLQRALQKQGKMVELVVMKTGAEIPFGYAWKGSPYERQYSRKGEIKTRLDDYQPQSAPFIIAIIRQRDSRGVQYVFQARLYHTLSQNCRCLPQRKH